LLYYLLASTRGGLSRVQILRYLQTTPVNANKLAIGLGLDNKTVLHHIRILEQNQLIISSQKDTYGQVYFLSAYLEAEYTIIEEIWNQVAQTIKEPLPDCESRRRKVSFSPNPSARKLRSKLAFGPIKLFAKLLFPDFPIFI
jgi:predicted transcriptional regulator